MWTPEAKAYHRYVTSLGGKTRAKNLSKERLSEIGRMGAEAKRRIAATRREAARLAQEARVA